MMKKYVIGISIVLIITLNILIWVFYNHKFFKKEELINNEMISILLETEDGKYESSSERSWPTSGYVLNIVKSYCENGSTLAWNKETKKVRVNIKGTDKCYVYFDKEYDGSENDPILIQSIEDLVRLANEVNSGDTKNNQNYLLVRDLDFNDPKSYEDAYRTDFGDINGTNGDEALITELTTGSGFTPIGEFKKESFDGNFDGGNHIIKNLFISRSGVSIAFIGWGSSFKISNLTLTGTINSRANEDSAGLVARADGTNIIENVILNLNVNSLSHSTGGFISSNGSGSNTKIINCQNNGKISNESGLISGLVAWTNGILTIENCINTGDITTKAANYIGGILGSDSGSSNITKINNSYNMGNIIINGVVKYYIGGLVGVNANGIIIIDKSYNLGNINKISSQSEGVDGGLIGEVRNKTYILNSFNEGNIINNSTVANIRSSGIIGNTIDNSKIVILNTYNAGNITLPIEIPTGTNYANGIYMGDEANSSSTVTLDNVYNIGNMQAKTTKNIGTLPIEGNYRVSHTYYIEGTNPVEQEAFIPLNKNVMYSSSFVDTLNQNAESINLEEIDPILKDYKLSKWKLGDNGYPTLINE